MKYEEEIALLQKQQQDSDLRGTHKIQQEEKCQKEIAALKERLAQSQSVLQAAKELAHVRLCGLLQKIQSYLPAQGNMPHKQDLQEDEQVLAEIENHLQKMSEAAESSI